MQDLEGKNTNTSKNVHNEDFVPAFANGISSSNSGKKNNPAIDTLTMAHK
jgi:hypothetical protein